MLSVTYANFEYGSNSHLARYLSDLSSVYQ